MPQTSPEHKARLAVVYLCWLPYGIEYLKRFIDSYKLHPAGADHNLVIVFNGTAQKESHEFVRYANENLPSFTPLELEGGQDIDAYFFAASQLKEDRILFLNSFAEFTAGDWLKKYNSVFESEPQTGVVGATGSYQSFYSDVLRKPFGWEKGKGFDYNFKKYKLFIKAFLYWRWLIASFPNPHVRTNAFMIGRTLFLSLKHRKLNRKFDAYLFESGRRSLTNQVLAKDYKVWLIDKEGRAYAPPHWRDSRTFWWSEQEGALVTDNQTEYYAKNAHTAHGQYLRHISWGA